MRIFTLPNAITSMNLLCGILGVICTLRGLPHGIAFGLMLAAAVFDFFDGMAARLLHSTSPIGKELDSLSDMVSFGVLPALMLVRCMEDGYGESWLCLLPLVLAVLSGYRLAKFNVDERQSTDFIGVPTPAAAVIAGSFACCTLTLPAAAALAATPWFLPLFSLLLGLLLVSEVPMFSIKVAKGHKLLDAKHLVFLGLSAAALLAGGVWQKNGALALLLVFVLYILENLVLFGISRCKDRR